MFKETIKFSIWFNFSLLINACNNHNRMTEKEKMQRLNDSVTEVRIDSIYKVILSECDTLRKYRVPQLAQSLLQKDTIKLKKFNDSLCFFSDSVPKVEKVVQQLKLDCDANLIKETFALAQRLKQVKPKQLTGKKP